jgi:Ser/Thr protein kinase RdoA (MazF antagonist)
MCGLVTLRVVGGAGSAHTVEVIEDGAGWPPGELRQVLREQAGLDLVALRPAGGGESRSVFWVTDRAGTVSVLKVMPGAGAEAAGRLRALDATAARLRDRGYPAPRFLAVGHVAGLVFWIQERLSGSALDRGQPEPDGGMLARLLPELLRLNDAQAGLGTGARGWPDLITRTLTSGGDGYCLHSTLQARPGTRDLLRVLRRIGERCGPAIPAGGDFVHYDFTPANLLSDGTAITGVIDVNPPVAAGDRAFDLATLLFYLYDQDNIRDPLRARLMELAGPQAACAYLRTWCCGKSTGRCASTPQPPLPGVTCTWQDSSPPTSTTARTEFGRSQSRRSGYAPRDEA